MQSFNQIIDSLKQITGHATDKAIAIELHIKPQSLATMKHRQKIPYKAILGYCRAHHINANEVLLDIPVEDGKVLVRYFRSLDAYGKFIGLPDKV